MNVDQKLIENDIVDSGYFPHLGEVFFVDRWPVIVENLAGLHYWDIEGSPVVRYWSIEGKSVVRFDLEPGSMDAVGYYPGLEERPFLDWAKMSKLLVAYWLRVVWHIDLPHFRCC